MNKYPMWWDKTITIYNKRIDANTQQVSWYRNVVENCFWKYENNKINVGQSYQGKIVLETKEVICRIPATDRFLVKSEWDALAVNQIHDSFTLSNGDIIVLGEVTDVIDDYTKGSRATDLVAKYKEQHRCLEVDTYIINTWQGVGVEHYRVIGK